MGIELIFAIVEAVLPGFQGVPGIFKLFGLRFGTLSRCEDSVLDEKNPQISEFLVNPRANRCGEISLDLVDF